MLDRVIEADEPIDGPTDTFHDIHDVIEKLEDNLLGHSHSSTSINSVSNPTLGELLQMEIT